MAAVCSVPAQSTASHAMQVLVVVHSWVFSGQSVGQTMAVRGGVSYDLHARTLFAARFIIQVKVVTVGLFDKSPVDIVKFFSCRLACMYQCFEGSYCLHLRSGSRRQ